MNREKIERNAQHLTCLLKALSNEKRLKILAYLSEKESSVGELEKVSGLSQSALSQHLAKMRTDGILKTRRDAQTIYYSIESECVKHTLEALSNLPCVK